MAIAPSKASMAAGPDAAGAHIGAGAFVVTQFREFYAEIQALRAAALVSARMADEAQVQPEAPPPPDPEPRLVVPIAGLAPPLPEEAIAAAELEDSAAPPEDFRRPGLTAEEAVQRLQSMLELQALDAGAQGGEYGVLYYKEAQYVMAALADEIFVTLDWSGRKFWRSDLLETRLFGTYNAGDLFYQRLDKLLQSGDRVQAEIAVVYLLALTLGFKGRLADPGDARTILEYKKKLHYYIYHSPPVLADPAHRMVPEAYQHNQTNLSARLLPSPSRWIWGVGAAVVIYLVASHHVFHDAMHPLIEELDRADRTLTEVLE